MNKIINIKRNEVVESKYPDDLMTFDEIVNKYQLTYAYLYKKSVLEGYITPYFKGKWNLSEKEVLNFLEEECERRLKKRVMYGGNK